jgi:small subunit ribosomal protein S6
LWYHICRCPLGLGGPGGFPLLAHPGAIPWKGDATVMREYEFTFIVRSNIEEPDLTAVIDQVKGLITDNGGEVVKLDLWGTRRLAYPIEQMREGQYVFMITKLPPQAMVELDRGLKLIEDVLRHLIVRIDE